MINEFKYGQTWKIWPSLLSLSLYNPFNWIFVWEDLLLQKFNLGETYYYQTVKLRTSKLYKQNYSQMILVI